jgi:antitoxin YefM
MELYNIIVPTRRRSMAIETTYSRARQNLAKLLDEVTVNKETVVIKRRRGEGVVMMAESDAASLLETAHLLRSPRNARRILEALERAFRGAGGTRMTADQVEELRDEAAGGGKKT